MAKGSGRRVEWLVILLIGVPLLGLWMGGVYALPAMKLSGERDPWLSLMLAGGLGLTVFGLGGTLGGTVPVLCSIFGGSIVLLLLARKVYGSLGHSLERFGLVHAAALLATLVGGMVGRVG